MHAQSYHGLFVDNLVWWSQDSRIAYFVDIERSTKVAKVLEFDTYTGATRCLFEEKSLSYIKLSHYFPRATILHIADSNELIWFSERSGWAHLYLYDLATGDLKNPITQGEWLVRNILHFDTKRRELWIQTAGRVTGRDPYYQDICRVNIDTGELTVVVSGNAEYTVLSPGTMAHYAARYYDPDIFVNACAVSSDADYVVTTRSRLDQVPVSLLLDRDGNTLQEMEVADLSSLPNTWVWPEPVKLLAADDETAIYGAIFKPSNFSPDKRYPVIDFSPYAPDSICSPKGAFLNNADGGFFYPHAAALAELGFIVVAIDGRGSPAREKAFSHANSGSWSASNFTEDRVSAIKQLGQKYPYIDVDRVGFLGLLSNGNELMDYPDFYKVGVYSNGIYDTRFLGAVFVERYEDNESRLERQSFEAGAIERLKGKLLLIHNLHSRVVAPAATLRVVDALKKANKDFDLLVFPGDMPERYAFRRTLDYFVQHLHGIDPPKEFNFEPDDGQAA